MKSEKSYDVLEHHRGEWINVKVDKKNKAVRLTEEQAEIMNTDVSAIEKKIKAKKVRASALNGCFKYVPSKKAPASKPKATA